MLKSVMNEQIASALHADIAAVCAEDGCTQDDMASALREHPKTFSGYLCGHARVPADLVARVSRRFGATRAIETVTRLAEPEPEPEDVSTVIPAVRKLMRECNEAVDAVLADVEDGKIDNVEGDVQECNEVIDALRYLVRILEGAVASMPPTQIATLAQAALVNRLRTPHRG